MKQEEANRKMGQVIARAWADESFKAKLLASPAETLKAEGVEVPPGVKVKAVENTKEVFHLVIPAKPAELSDQDLDQVAGGNYSDKCGNSWWFCFETWAGYDGG